MAFRFVHFKFNQGCLFSIISLRLRLRLHCQFPCLTLGEESTCEATTSNVSFPWAPTTSLGRWTGSVTQVQSLGQLGNCCKKCGLMGCSAIVFPSFVGCVNIVSMFLERDAAGCTVVDIYYNFFHLHPYIGLAYGPWG